MEQMRQDMRLLEKRFDEIKKTLDEVHLAIVGNPLLNGTGGIAARLQTAEEEVSQLKDEFIKAEKRFELRMFEAEKKQMKYNIWTKITWIAISGAITMTFAYILQLIFKK